MITLLYFNLLTSMLAAILDQQLRLVIHLVFTLLANQFVARQSIFLSALQYCRSHILCTYLHLCGMKPTTQQGSHYIEYTLACSCILLAFDFLQQQHLSVEKFALELFCYKYTSCTEDSLYLSCHIKTSKFDASYAHNQGRQVDCLLLNVNQ